MNERDIERAVKAIQEAPHTESGIIIPPHVATALTEPEEPVYKPNRAQRRRNEKAARKHAKRYARLNPQQAEALREVEEAASHLSGEELLVAQAILKQPDRVERILEFGDPDDAA